MDCLFCKIIKDEIPAKKVYEDENVLGFLDLYPQAKEHYLFISKNHTHDINELSEKSQKDLIFIFQAISYFTRKEKKDVNGFRIVTNLGKDAGQTVFHTHFHVLSGEKLGTFGR